MPVAISEAKIDLKDSQSPATDTKISLGHQDLVGDAVGGYRLKNYPINDLFQYLAREAGKQYFANPDLQQFVSGQMKEGKPIERMQEVAFQYGITLYEKSDTIYAIPNSDIANLPVKQAEFKLRYLRPDRARLSELINPFLTKDSGSVDFEDKTDTVVIHDNDPAIARVADFLDKVDIPQRQITIQVRVFRISTDAENHVGVDWSQSLGVQGTSLTATAASAMQTIFGYGVAKQVIGTLANSSILPNSANLFNLASTNVNSTMTMGTNSLSVGPTTVTAILRALYSTQNVEEENNPTVVTEDNEEALIENIDKIPIVTTTTDTSSAGSTLSSTVRYRIDPDDPFDVGVKVKVRPTILPGNQIRLVVEPSVGSVTGYTSAASGDAALPNQYPQVALSRMKNIAMIPNGYTLLFGGYQRVTTSKSGSKVPILGDIPVVNFLFKSRGNTKVRENIVFMITATASNMSSPDVETAETERIRRTYVESKDDQRAEDDKLNLSPDANLVGTIQDELTPYARKRPSSHPMSPNNPANQGLQPLTTPEEVEQAKKASSLTYPTPTPSPSPKKAHNKKPWEYIVPAKSDSSAQADNG